MTVLLNTENAISDDNIRRWLHKFLSTVFVNTLINRMRLHLSSSHTCMSYCCFNWRKQAKIYLGDDIAFMLFCRLISTKLTFLFLKNKKNICYNMIFDSSRYFLLWCVTTITNNCCLCRCLFVNLYGCMSMMRKKYAIKRWQYVLLYPLWLELQLLLIVFIILLKSVWMYCLCVSVFL